ncbi:hypothetical protein NQD34_011077 [Periophthalmus magnuspinnatus]|nr:hypothetical protein NQD34_011077 [Periophthalmus magnuspinnatus]
MEEEHIARLKAEFDVCDSRGCGLLDRNDLTTLCQRLHLPLSHLSLLQDRLLGPPSPLHTEGPPPHREGPSREGQVNFEEFKQGFVEILAKSVDLSISEDDSSYLQPVLIAVVPEVSPKFIKGLKRYGRRSRPERPDSEPDSDQNPDHDQDQDHNRSTEGFRGAKLRKATSLESIESLKSDEEPPTQEPPQEEQQGALYTGGVIQVHEGDTQDVLWRLQDQDLQGRVLCSTPLRPALVPSEEHSFHLTSCSLISEGRRLLSVLDNGNGTTSPDRILSLWRDEGLQDCQHVLQVLDFCLDDPVSLSDLTVALDNELMVSSNSVHQAALISYRTELQTLTTLLDESCRQRDKAKFDLDQAELRNLQLLREEEERQNLTETSAQNRIRQVELACKGRVSGLRAQMEQEAESAEREKIALQRTLAELTARESVLQGELCTLRQENVSLEQDLSALRLTLNDSQTYVHKLHQDLHRLLQDKFSLDPSGGAVSPEEHFSEIIKEYELQCRELRDRYDELSSELELVKIKKPERRSKPDQDQNLSWRPQDQGLNRDQGLNQEQTSGYDISEVSSSPRVRRKLTPLDKTALCTLDPGLDPGLNSGPNSGPSVSIQTELALEQLQEKHQEEVHQLTAKMETQVNFYERSLEQMRQNMELERKDIAQAYKMEICELEDQKSSLEIQLKQMKENLEKSQQRQDQQRGHDKRLQRERAEMEQNFAREISNLVQKLSAEKEQVEAELRLKMDQELLLLRTQLEEVRSENSALEERVSLLQQEVAVLEEEVDRKRRKMEEIERDQERMREEQEKLHKENSGLREQMLELSTRNLELSSSNADLSCKTRGDKEALVQVQERLRSLGREQEEHSATVQRLKEELVQSERDKQQRLNSWTQEKHLLQTELSAAKSKVGLVSELEAKLQSLGLKLKWSEDDNGRLRRDAEKRQQQVEQLSASLSSLEIEAESLRAQIQSTNQEALSHKQEVTQAQRRLQEAHNKVEELESSLRKFIAEKEEVTSSFEAELKQLRVANQELESKVQEVQVENQQIHKLHQQEMELRTQLGQLETAKTQAQDQALRADTALSLVQAQHLRQIHQIQTESKSESRTKEELDSALDQLRDERLRRERAEQELRERERGDQQGEYERTVSLLQERTQDLEIQLKATRSLLQEKVQQLQDQVTRAARSGSLVQQLYLENSELQGALQATEQRHRQAQKKSQALESKVQALNRVLRQLVPHALS